MLYFATGNKHKFAEAQRILGQQGIALRRFVFRHREIRSERLEEIAREAVAAAYHQLQKPVFVEDTGLFIPALNGFPGPYSGWVLGKIGTRGILRLLSGRDRRAYFETCVALATKQGIKTFSARCPGRIARRPRGRSGFGYDPIFVPHGYRRTFAEGISLKNKLSHRYKTLLALSRYL